MCTLWKRIRRVGFKVGFRIGFRVGFRFGLRVDFRVRFGVGFRVGFRGDSYLRDFDDVNLTTTWRHD